LFISLKGIDSKQFNTSELDDHWHISEVDGYIPTNINFINSGIGWDNTDYGFKTTMQWTGSLTSGEDFEVSFSTPSAFYGDYTLNVNKLFHVA
jgi:hypothetical protein